MTQFKETQEISNEEYNGIPFSFRDFIQNHVNKESEKWSDEEFEEQKLPEYKPVKVQKNKVGWKVFLLQLKP